MTRKARGAGRGARGRVPGLWALLLLGASSLAPGGCLADSGDAAVGAAPRIRASGQAEVVVAPDRAWVDLAVVTRELRAAAAVAGNAEASARVMAALGAALDPEAEIVSAGYSLAPNYRYVQGEGQKLDGFIARNRLRVTLPDVNGAGPVIDAATVAGASEIQQVSYGLADDTPARREALAEATRNAVARAGVMAGALDMKVHRVLSVEDSGAAATPVVREVQMLAKSAGGASVPTDLRPGGVRVRAQVTVYVEVGP